MKLQLQISTIDEGIGKIPSILLSPEENVTYLISHQLTGKSSYPVPEALKRDDVEVINICGKGLSANRNNCIRHASGDIAVILDDDVRLKPEYVSEIMNIFSSDEEVDVACCKIRTMPGEPEYKKYGSEKFRMTRIGQFKSVSSVEIVYRVDKVRDNGILFDERFGLGTSLVSGEELIFLNDCMQKGLKIMYYPVYIVGHACQSSGKTMASYSDERLFLTGAQAYAIYGRLSCIRNLLAAVRRYKDYSREGITFSHFLRLKQAGSHYLSALR